MTPFRITEEARCDIRRIAKHYTRTSGSNHWFVDEVERAIDQLRRFPESGHHRDDLHDDTLRCWTVAPYVIIYRVEAGTLVVVAVVHASRDLERVIGES